MNEINEKSSKINGLTMRQMNLLRGKVAGLTLKECARDQGYKSHEAVSRLTSRPEGRAELLRLHAETNQLFLESMQQLTKDAIETLQDTMQFGDSKSSNEAAMFILKFLSLPLANSGLIQVESIQPLEPLEAEIITKE